MIRKWDEVSISKEQWHSSFDTERRDNDVRCLADGDSLFAECPIIFSALFRHGFAEHFKSAQRKQSSLGQTILAIVPDALEDFQENQITHGNSTLDNSGIESICMLALNAIEVVDPNAGIDQYHFPPRISSRSPSHLTRPRSLRISCCWLRKRLHGDNFSAATQLRNRDSRLQVDHVFPDAQGQHISELAPPQ